MADRLLTLHYFTEVIVESGRQLICAVVFGLCGAAVAFTQCSKSYNILPK